jgi:LmbE family N-acetylglucosaminyl deacetylase
VKGKVLTTLEPILVVSPHCDDAVFACGQLLAAYPGSLVVTVFAGRPPAGIPLPEWDQAAGFQPGDDVVGARRAEDRAALNVLAAEPVWLDFCDSQYRCSPSINEVGTALHEVIAMANPCSVFFPLGLFHSDHQLVHDAVLPLLRQDPKRLWFVYAEALYRCIPGLVNEKLHLCTATGLQPESVVLPVHADGARKSEAVHCYRSQLRALRTPGRPGYNDVFAPEQFWRLHYSVSNKPECGATGE